jgi:hypothetical protein
MIVPHIKKISDFCHSNGLWFQHHCCGKNELLVPAMIDMGVDIWLPQPMNDTDMLHEKYGDKVIFCVTPPIPAQDATDEEIEKIAEEFVAKFAPTFTQKPILASTFFAGPKMTLAIYRQSRIALSK